MLITVEEAARKISAGDVVAVPTETVYGLAASLYKDKAIDKIFTLKGRPCTNPLIIHVADCQDLLPFVKEFPCGFDDLAKTFWPGALTLILAVHEDAVCEKARAGLPTAGFRIPSDPIAHSLLKLTGPLVMPSANLSGKPSATSHKHIELDFGKDFPVIAANNSKQGLESTILIFIDGLWQVIRLGAIPLEGLTSVLGYKPKVSIAPNKGEKPLCPGQLFRHYAPKANLKIVKVFSDDMQGVVVGFSDRSYPENTQIFSLGKSTDSQQVAANLYSTLRLLDDRGIENAYVDGDFPAEGLWLTIDERLKRAAQRD